MVDQCHANTVVAPKERYDARMKVFSFQCFDQGRGIALLILHRQ